MSKLKTTTRREQILSEMEGYGEDWGDFVSCTMFDPKESLDDPFEPGYMRTGPVFYLWTTGRVYFVEWCSDAAIDRVTSVPRNPTNIEQPMYVGG